MKELLPRRDWLFVVRTPFHLAEVKAGEKTWWCADRRCKRGDRAFIYVPLEGVRWFLRVIDVLDPSQSQTFCESFKMATVVAKILNVFTPPIKARQLRADPNVRLEGFVGRNFQAKAFMIRSDAATDAILAITKRPRSEAKSQHSRLLQRVRDLERRYASR
ncbi:MAG TPA: hypothetical protein VG206_05415 [Terriglobia bacterium]|nr:hypothetical protein [Terriglobia bacterium]